MTREKKIRIACYNILYGGKGRLQYIAKVIKKINPDICGLLEVVGSPKDFKNLKLFSKHLGYRIFYIAKGNSKYNIAILSRIPVVNKTIKTGFGHVVLKTTLKNKLLKNINVFFVHLSPVSEDARLLEIKNLLKQAKKRKGLIIMGDFNSLSPYDPYDKRELMGVFKKSHITKYGIKKLRFDVIKKIRSFGFIDAFNFLNKRFITTVPTVSNQDKNHPTNLRIDYAFLSEDIIKYLRLADIVKDNSAEKASDHYPLFIDLLF